MLKTIQKTKITALSRPIAHLLLCSLLCLSLMACTSAAANSGQITVEALSEQIEQGTAPLVLDVRSPEEYAAGHIPGAINIEYTQVPNQIDSLQAYVGEAVVVYCERGVRAGRAEAALAEAGFSRVLHLRGDIAAWRDSGLPVESLPTD